MPQHLDNTTRGCCRAQCAYCLTDVRPDDSRNVNRQTRDASLVGRDNDRAASVGGAFNPAPFGEIKMLLCNRCNRLRPAPCIITIRLSRRFARERRELPRITFVGDRRFTVINPRTVMQTVTCPLRSVRVRISRIFHYTDLLGVNRTFSYSIR